MAQKEGGHARVLALHINSHQMQVGHQQVKPLFRGKIPQLFFGAGGFPVAHVVAAKGDVPIFRQEIHELSISAHVLGHAVGDLHHSPGPVGHIGHAINLLPPSRRGKPVFQYFIIFHILFLSRWFLLLFFHGSKNFSVFWPSGPFPLASGCDILYKMVVKCGFFCPPAPCIPAGLATLYHIHPGKKHRLGGFL